MTLPRKVVFLDRDGVINTSPGAQRYVLAWEAFEFRSGALAMLAELFSSGYRLVVITNQQGVGKGLIDARELDRIHANMGAAIEKNGARIDGIFHCPHLEAENCACRKPKPGLIFNALKSLGYEVDLEGSWFVGDSPVDMQAGRAAGLRTLLVGPPGKCPTDPLPTRCADRLSDIAAEIAGSA